MTTAPTMADPATIAPATAASATAASATAASATAAPATADPATGASEGAVCGFSHAGITVADLDRSIAFYELLGYEVIARWVRTEEYLRELVGYPTVDLHAAVLRHDRVGVFLEILEYRNIERKEIDPSNGNPGTAHICLFVEGFEALWGRLKAAGVEAVSDPVSPTVGPNKGALAIYLIDPDGHRVELVETKRNLDGTLR